MVQAGTGRMRLTEQELRCVTLAQAVERADTAHALVSAVELDDATRQAALQARQGGVQRVGVADVVLGRAQAIVERARARDTTIAALCIPRWHAAMRALPAVALLMGLAADRIANAHRVDLLSPPLLAVVAWNLAVYVLMLWRALRRPADAEHAVSVLWALQGFLLRWQAGLGRTARRALAGRIVAEFETLWLQRSHALLALRTAHVLHLCAAAWAAGIALSLLLRGLVVNYRFGWESTFLDAAQVHAIVSVLFWPMTAVFGLAPLALQDIVATQDFAGEGVAGSRWVWMYVGLLLLVVILPRLCLAVWAQWHALRQVRQCALDTGETSFDTLRTALPADLELGLVGASALCCLATVRSAAPSMPCWCATPHWRRRFPSPGRRRPCTCCPGPSGERAGCRRVRCSSVWKRSGLRTTPRCCACARPGWPTMRRALLRRCKSWHGTCAPAPLWIPCRTMPMARMCACCGRWRQICARCTEGCFPRRNPMARRWPWCPGVAPMAWPWLWGLRRGLPQVLQRARRSGPSSTWARVG